MSTLPNVKAHFDGTALVPEDPLPLVPGEKVRVTIEREVQPSTQPRRSLRGIAKGTFELSGDFNGSLECFDEYR